MQINGEVQVKFTRSAGIYNAGEVAGFTPEYAKKLVLSRCAEFVRPADPPPDTKKGKGKGDDKAPPAGGDDGTHQAVLGGPDKDGQVKK